MALTRSFALRWLAVPVLALVAVLAAQVLLFQLSLAALAWVRGPAVGDGIWAAKTVASFFMGATFVAVASWVAPAYRRRVSLVAFGSVVLWGSRLASSAFEGGTFPWLLGMALAGVLGGAYALARTPTASSATAT